jgi:hypothetical protein
MSGAAFHRGESKQDYETPWGLIRAVERRFGQEFDWDLAATPGQQKAPRFIAPPGAAHAPCDLFSDDGVRDALGLCWLNPEFGDLKRWSRRAAEVAGPHRRVVMLAPAAVSTEWFAEYVWPHAHVVAIRPRVKFVGHEQGFPKDLMFACYGGHPPTWAGPTSTMQLWRWDET